MAKVVCVLYDDPVDGYPKSYARDGLPKIDSYPGGQSLPTPEAIDFTPGTLLGSVSGELGLRKYLESQGHEFVVTSDKGRSQLGVRTRACGCRRRDLATLFGPPISPPSASQRPRTLSSRSRPASARTTST